MTVYLDLVMLMNFAVDFLLLLGTDRLSGFPGSVKQCAWAALLGAVYSGTCLLPGFSFLGHTFWRLVCLGFMASVAFGWNRSAWNRMGVFVLLSMALGGISLGLDGGNFMLLTAAAGVWCLCRIGFGGHPGRQYVPVEVLAGEKRASVIALRDTGNSLCDPITGEPVMILSSRIAQLLWGLTQEQLRNPLETVVRNPGFRLIPYRAVGQPGSMLIGLRTDVITEGIQRRTVVAFAPEEIGRGQCYQALVS